MTHIDSQGRGQIGTLVAVLASSIAFALFLTAMLAYNYGPSGTYSVKDALIEPRLATTLSYNDVNQKTGGNSRFIFNGIEFSYYNSYDQQLRSIPIAAEQYERFYQMISGDVSLLPIPENVEKLFNNSENATLLVNVRTESHAAWQNESKIFQQVNFSVQDDYYRIQLHEQAAANNWAYFYHPHIYQDVIKLFVQ